MDGAFSRPATGGSDDAGRHLKEEAEPGTRSREPVRCSGSALSSADVGEECVDLGAQRLRLLAERVG
jgi:hypothetical protein